MGYPLLDNISTPAQLKKLPLKELPLLAAEIRNFLIENVTQTGGHLASNLGVVELTLALHYVFSLPQDKIIWDVGHQCYVHKLLTARRPLFPKLRQYQGLSGFPSPSESPYDPVFTGHSSTAISLALGMAVRRDFENKKFNIIAVVGDGSLTGGLAFEAMNHGGELNKDIIIILNDNRMSISKNIGAMARYLNKLITGKLYNTLKEDVRSLLAHAPLGLKITQVAQKIERSLKHLAVPGILFEEFGFRYFGPLSGHNLFLLVDTFKKIKDLKGPRFIHVLTTKGKGFKPAEGSASKYHSLPSKAQARFKNRSYASVLGKTLTELATGDSRIVGITAAMKLGTGLEEFEKHFPQRCFDVGIAESHAVTFAAGLAVAGARPVVAIYSTFLQRAYDQILHDVCLPNLPVIFAVSSAGVSGPDGPTHQGIFDLSFLRHIPNIIIMSPKDRGEFREMLKKAFTFSAPVAIRYPKESFFDSFSLYNINQPIELGKSEVLSQGEDGYIFALGELVEPALKAASWAAQDGLSVGVINARFVKPIDEAKLKEIAQQSQFIISLEDGIRTGGLGSSVLELLKGSETKLEVLGFPDKFIEQGSRSELLLKYGLSAENIYKTIKSLGGERKSVLIKKNC
jgi:1-deoxy-D-xylulose-5-phosphate synthase